MSTFKMEIGTNLKEDQVATEVVQGISDVLSEALRAFIAVFDGYGWENLFDDVVWKVEVYPGRVVALSTGSMMFVTEPANNELFTEWKTFTEEVTMRRLTDMQEALTRLIEEGKTCEPDE